MLVPGEDILDIAFDVINTETVQYIPYDSRVSNTIGVYQTTYGTPIDVEGSFQPVPRNVYLEEGLNFQKSYYNFYARMDFLDIGRDVTSDRLIFGGRLYQVQSATRWFNLDGWSAIRCIDIGENVSIGFGIYGVMT